MLNNKINKGESRVHYKLKKLKKKGDYKILEDISEMLSQFSLWIHWEM